jgi:hypothetical protein
MRSEMSLVLLALDSDEGRLAAILAEVGMSGLRRLQPSGVHIDVARTAPVVVVYACPIHGSRRA